MVWCLTLQFASVCLFAALAHFGFNRLWPMYLLAAAFGAARAFYSPASSALMPTLAPRRLLPRAIAMSSLSRQMASVLGPAVGGLLVAVSPTLAFGVAGAGYLIALGFVSGIVAPAQSGPRGASRLELIREGLLYLWTNTFVMGAISLDLFAVLLGGATALLPVFARDVLHVGSQGFGILRAAPAVGGMVMAVLLGTRPIKRRAGLKMFVGVAGFGLATVVFALSRFLWLSAVALAFLGAFDMISVFVRQSLVQIATPNEMRGRIGALSFLFVGASNELGEFESGVVARILGPVGAALFGGIGSLVVTGAWAGFFPQLRRADKLG
jgi:MFS-type transporter involved in bile tolerance (Atg22 family)